MWAQQISSQNIMLRSCRHMVLRNTFNVVNCSLKEVLTRKIPEQQDRIRKIRKESGNIKIGDVTIDNIFNGMRGVTSLFCDTSMICDNGINFRDHSLMNILKDLPKVSENGQPLPEGLFWLFMTGDIPTKNQTNEISIEWAERATIPDFVQKLIDSFPPTLPPIAQLSCSLSAMSHASLFQDAVQDKVSDRLHWENVYEDSMNIIAQLPLICSRIYRNTYFNGLKKETKIDVNSDWTNNFIKLCGIDNSEFVDMMRLYFTIHSDHEGGAVCSHAAHLVGSTLSNPYLSYASAINSLAGPLHGMGNRKALTWLYEIKDKYGDDMKENTLKTFIQETLWKNGEIPGYGHAILRTIDPRFTCQYNYAVKHFPEDDLVKLVSMLSKIAPPILQAHGMQNPWPNVDACSGVLLRCYGMKELEFFTVLLAMARSLGVLSSMIWHRALKICMERPNSITTNYIVKAIKAFEKPPEEVETMKPSITKDAIIIPQNPYMSIMQKQSNRNSQMQNLFDSQRKTNRHESLIKRVEMKAKEGYINARKNLENRRKIVAQSISSESSLGLPELIEKEDDIQPLISAKLSTCQLLQQQFKCRPTRRIGGATLTIKESFTMKK